MNAGAVILLLREHGIWGLLGDDGCDCAHGTLHGVSIDIACHKSSGGLPPTEENKYSLVVRVYSSDAFPEELERVADEIIVLLRGEGKGQSIIVRFCDWQHDSEQACIYCNKPRADFESYLCEACKVGEDAFGDKIINGRQFKTIRTMA